MTQSGLSVDAPAMDEPRGPVMQEPSDAGSESSASITAWQNATFTMVHSALVLLYRVLGLTGLYNFGRIFGACEWLINYKRRRRFAQAVTRVLGRPPPPPDRRRITREYFQQSRCDKLFYLIIDAIPQRRASGLLTITNQPMLDAAAARGHGVYVALSHHGPHHVLAMLMSLKGYRVAGVRDRREGGLRRYVQDRWDRLHPGVGRMRVLFADSYPRDVYRCFQEGCLVGSAMDVSRLRHPNQKTADAELFGERRSFLIGPLRVAMRCRAPVLQGFIVPERNFRYRLDLTATLIDPEGAGSDEQVISQAISTYAANVEHYIRERPALVTRV